MNTYSEKQLPAGWYLQPVRDVAGDKGWVVFDRDGEPQVHLFTKKETIKNAVEFAREKGLLPRRRS